MPGNLDRGCQAFLRSVLLVAEILLYFPSAFPVLVNAEVIELLRPFISVV